MGTQHLNCSQPPHLLLANRIRSALEKLASAIFSIITAMRIFSSLSASINDYLLTFTYVNTKLLAEIMSLLIVSPPKHTIVINNFHCPHEPTVFTFKDGSDMYIQFKTNDFVYSCNVRYSTKKTTNK